MIDQPSGNWRPITEADLVDLPKGTWVRVYESTVYRTTGLKTRRGTWKVDESHSIEMPEYWEIDAAYTPAKAMAEGGK